MSHIPENNHRTTIDLYKNGLQFRKLTNSNTFTRYSTNILSKYQISNLIILKSYHE